MHLLLSCIIVLPITVVILINHWLNSEFVNKLMKWRGSVLQSRTSITAWLSPEEFTSSLTIADDVLWCQYKCPLYLRWRAKHDNKRSSYFSMINPPVLHISLVFVRSRGFHSQTVCSHVVIEPQIGEGGAKRQAWDDACLLAHQRNNFLAIIFVQPKLFRQEWAIRLNSNIHN